VELFELGRVDAIKKISISSISMKEKLIWIVDPKRNLLGILGKSKENKRL
jgi:hypothetical protein